MIEVDDEQVLKLEYVLSQSGRQQPTLATFDPDDPRARQTYFTYKDGKPYNGAFNKDFKTDTYYTGVTFGPWSEKLIELKKPVKIDPNDVQKLPTLESELRTYENSFVGVDDFSFLANLGPDDRVDRPLEQLALMSARALPMSEYPRGFMQNGLNMYDTSYQPRQTVTPIQPTTAFEEPVVSRPVLQPTEADRLMQQAPTPIISQTAPMRINALTQDIDDVLSAFPGLSRERTQVSLFRDTFLRNVEDSYMASDTLSELEGVLDSAERVWQRMKPRVVTSVERASPFSDRNETPIRAPSFATTSPPARGEAGPSSESRVISEQGGEMISPNEALQREQLFRDSSPLSSNDVIDDVPIPWPLRGRTGELRIRRLRYVTLHKLTGGKLPINVYVVASAFKHARSIDAGRLRLEQEKDTIMEFLQLFVDAQISSMSEQLFVEKFFNVHPRVAEEFIIAKDIVVNRRRQI